MSPMRRVILNFDKRDVAALRRVADERQVSANSIVREALARAYPDDFQLDRAKEARLRRRHRATLATKRAVERLREQGRRGVR